MWRNRDTFVTGRAEIVTFLTAECERELDYLLRTSLWAFTDVRIAVRSQYEWHDASGQWTRSHGNQLGEFDAHGLMRRREAPPRPADARGARTGAPAALISWARSPARRSRWRSARSGPARSRSGRRRPRPPASR
ncbi:MAG TPA: DUF1348 family protein [Modestobacter sp.]|nr:DUF1348 family protein [Modestobacter sp.]